MARCSWPHATGTSLWDDCRQRQRVDDWFRSGFLRVLISRGPDTVHLALQEQPDSKLPVAIPPEGAVLCQCAGRRQHTEEADVGEVSEGGLLSCAGDCAD